MPKLLFSGVQSWEEALEWVDSGVDALGFHFFAGPFCINPEKAREIVKRLPPFVSAVGVFKEEKKYHVQEISLFCCLDNLLFLGKGFADCTGFAQPVIKEIDKKLSEQEMASYFGVVRAFLLDHKSEPEFIQMLQRKGFYAIIACQQDQVFHYPDIKKLPVSGLAVFKQEECRETTKKTMLRLISSMK